MSVIVISETVQEFLGVSYYKCGIYYQRHGQRLHRVVWKHYNGSIPRRAHIHHRDLDTSNNQPDNLSCVTADEHLSFHGKLRGGESAARLAEHARPAASAWHGSTEGLAWHKKHWEQDCAATMYAREDRRCDQCGTSYAALKRSVERFCTNACKSKWRRDDGRDNVERQCEGCRNTFLANRFKAGLYCSRECSDRFVAGKYERTVATYRCHHCGTAFEAKDRRSIWCSNRCKRANDRRKAKGLQPLSGPG